MKILTMAACAFLLWILQAALFHRFWNKNLKARLRFSSYGVTEGQCVTLKETITNAKAFPIPVLHVKFQMGKHLVFTASGNSNITDNNYRSDIFSCMPWQEIRRSLEIFCQKRGYYTISQVQLVSYDLFFTGHMVACLPADAALYVYPRQIPAKKLDLPLRSLLGQINARRSLIRDPFEIQTVRPYEPYDSYRAVNWKATARTGQLKVNVYAPTASWQVLFLLDMDSDKIWKDESLTEESIRLCATYSHLLIKEGIPVAVYSNGTDSPSDVHPMAEASPLPYGVQAGAGFGHGQTVMEYLARIRPQKQGQLSMEQVLEEMARAARLPDSTVYILISPQQRDSIARSFAHLCRQSPGCQWILPFRPNEEIRLKTSFHISVFPWEVPYDHSQAS